MSAAWRCLKCDVIVGADDVFGIASAVNADLATRPVAVLAMVVTQTALETAQWVGHAQRTMSGHAISMPCGPVVEAHEFDELHKLTLRDVLDLATEALGRTLGPVRGPHVAMLLEKWQGEKRHATAYLVAQVEAFSSDDRRQPWGISILRVGWFSEPDPTLMTVNDREVFQAVLFQCSGMSYDQAIKDGESFIELRLPRLKAFMVQQLAWRGEEA